MRVNNVGSVAKVKKSYRQKEEEWREGIEKKKTEFGEDKILVLPIENGFHERAYKFGDPPFMIEKWQFSPSWMKEVTDIAEVNKMIEELNVQRHRELSYRGGVVAKEAL